jgi:hypothetical protein
MSTPIPFPHFEADVVHSLNVPRSVVREKRAGLTEGLDWRREKRRGASEVAWSEAGLARLRDLILPAAEKAPSEALASEAGPSVEKPGGDVLEVVARVHPAQAWLLPCVGEGESRDRACWVFVRVAHGENFVPGMKIRAERGNYGAWRYLGKADDPPDRRARYPRGRGIW